jgi:hypothetical protein
MGLLAFFLSFSWKRKNLKFVWSEAEKMKNSDSVDEQIREIVS